MTFAMMISQVTRFGYQFFEWFDGRHAAQ